MSENYSLKELNEWADKVIEGISKWADEVNKAFNGSPASITIEKLDFSEHDKVFEDKIAELKKDYNTASELLGKYQQENESLKKRIQELDTIDAMRIDEKRELKQRIAELEEKNKNLVDMINELQLEKAHIDCDLYDANKRIAELEKKECIKTMRIEFHADNGEMLTPLEVANSLINQNTFKVDELKELAEILEVYYRHHRDKDKDFDDLW